MLAELSRTPGPERAGLLHEVRHCRYYLFRILHDFFVSESHGEAKLSNTAFAQVTFSLDILVNNIFYGGRSVCQTFKRPFVWPNTKVRDLFDSMYRGYPVGYLLFWANGLISGHKTIGSRRQTTLSQPGHCRRTAKIDISLRCD